MWKNLTFVCLFFLFAYLKRIEADDTYFTKKDWIFKKEAQIVNGDIIGGITWNDPSVMKDEASGRYRMWLSGGTGVGINNVELYHAWSTDGVSGWSINKTPIVTRSANTGDWDDEKIETPNVILVNGTYHLYYSGSKTEYMEGNRVIRYQIGHATSNDGINFKKDSNNPVIKYHMDDMKKFGVYLVGEPAAVYYPPENSIYLFYTCIKIREGSFYPFFSTNSKVYAICGQKADEFGSNFTSINSNHTHSPHVPVLSQSATYPVSKNYVGYSTPYAWVSNTSMVSNENKYTIHLMYDVVLDPEGRFTEFQQVSLAHAIVVPKNNSICAFEVENDILNIGEGNMDWIKTEIRAPSILEENGQWRMWFAGHSMLSVGGWKAGIGYGISNMRNFTNFEGNCTPYVEEFGFSNGMIFLSFFLVFIAICCCVCCCPCGGFLFCLIPLILAGIWTFIAL